MIDPESNPYAGYAEWKAWNPASFGRYTKKDSVVFSCELRRAGVTLSTNSRVLEVGFGNGAFAGWIRQWTTNYVGTENNSELVSRARHAGIEAHEATLDLTAIAQGRTFDLIAVFDVFEHLQKKEILQLLRTAQRCLSSTGCIVIRVPSGDSPFSGHLMHGDLTHQTLLGSFAFCQLAEQTGLRVSSIHDAAFPILGLGLPTAIRRIAVTSVRTVISRLLKIAYYANEPVVLTPDLIAVLRMRV